MTFHYNFTFNSLSHHRALFLPSKHETAFTCDVSQDEELVYMDDSDDKVLSLDFDVLIGSDGAHSNIRQQLNGSFDTLTDFQFNGGGIHFKPSRPLIGHTVIAKFKVTPIDGCPDIRLEHKDNPFFIASKVHGVRSVFKRFFFQHCEVQIAIDPSLVNKDADGIPWELLLRVSQEILANSPTSIADLRKHYLTHVSLLEIPIRRIHPSAVFQLPSNQHVIFVGDAQVSALYRLATGVNFQISNLPHLRRILQLGTSSRHLKQWTRLRELMDKRIDELIATQLSTLFFETLCGLVVFQDEYWRLDGHGFNGPLSNKEAYKSCNRTASPAWEYSTMS